VKRPSVPQSTKAAGFVMLRRAFLKDPDISGDAKGLAAVLSAFADLGGWAWPSRDTLRDLTGWGFARIGHARVELLRIGALQAQRQLVLKGRKKVCEWKFRVLRRVLAGPLAAGESPRRAQAPHVELDVSVFDTSKSATYKEIQEGRKVSVQVNCEEDPGENLPAALVRTDGDGDEAKAVKHEVADPHDVTPWDPTNLMEDCGRKAETKGFGAPVRADANVTLCVERKPIRSCRLADLLGIDRDRIRSKDRAGGRYLDRAWEEAGRPTDRMALADFLDRRLKWMERNGLRYPAVFLRALKQLQRGETIERTVSPAAATPQPDNRLVDVQKRLRIGTLALWRDARCRRREKTPEGQCEAFLRWCDAKGHPLEQGELAALREVTSCEKKPEATPLSSQGRRDDQ
jgi:hypothetical protein